MPKFCTQCGRPLQEGEVCQCTQNAQNQAGQQFRQVPPPQEAGQQFNQVPPQGASQQFQQVPPQMQYQKPQPNVAGEFFKKIYYSFINVLKAPATRGASLAASGDVETAAGLIAVQAVFTALFALCICGKVNKLFSLLDWLSVHVEVSVPKAFLVTFLISIVLTGVYAGVLLLVSILFKSHMTYKMALSTVAVRSVIAVPSILLSILVFFLNPVCGIGLFYLTGIGGICYMAAAFPVSSPEKKDRTALILFISTIIFIVIAAIIMSKSVQFYVPGTVKNELQGLTSNPEQYFKDLISDNLFGY